MTGPLAGTRIVEIAGLGPGPFAGMALSDLGADVIRVDRPDAAPKTARERRGEYFYRGRRSIIVDLKAPKGVQVVHRLAATSHAMYEGFRPGVAERLGIGPQALLAQNASLVYARATGWGQEGPYSSMAGHDLNYISVSGVLSMVGRAGAHPTPPLVFLGDVAGGISMALGIVAALHHAQRTGVGQVLDSAMVDASAYFGSVFYNDIQLQRPRGCNEVDSGAHYYDVYGTADGRYLSVAPIEEHFYRNFLRIAGLDPTEVPHCTDEPARWPELKKLIAARIRTKSRDEWWELFEGRDACVAPVLTPEEAVRNEHNVARATFFDVDGEPHPVPSPRFSLTELRAPSEPPEAGSDTIALLREAGYPSDDVDQLVASGVCGVA